MWRVHGEGLECGIGEGLECGKTRIWLHTREEVDGHVWKDRREGISA